MTSVHCKYKSSITGQVKIFCKILRICEGFENMIYAGKGGRADKDVIGIVNPFFRKNKAPPPLWVEKQHNDMIRIHAIVLHNDRG